MRALRAPTRTRNVRVVYAWSTHKTTAFMREKLLDAQQTVRMMDEEKEILKYIAKARGFSVSEYIRIATMHHVTHADEKLYHKYLLDNKVSFTPRR